MDNALPSFSVFEVIVETVTMTPTVKDSGSESFYFSTKGIADKFIKNNQEEATPCKHVTFTIVEHKVNQPG